MKDQQVQIVTVQVPAEIIYNILSKVEALQQTVSILKQEKELPETLTLKQASAALNMPINTLYNKIYATEISVTQNKKRGKILIAREEIIRYKSQNCKSL